jgi:carboxymethylenebutenolidase
MNQEIINLYDEYTHAPLKRDVFLKRLTTLVGSTAAAMSILPLLEANYVQAATHHHNHLITERISYSVEGGEMKGYLAYPETKEKLPSVLVIHENRGLNPHIEDVTRRAADAGFLALAVDALSLQGGTPENQDLARDMFSKLNAENNLQNFLKGFDYLKTRKESNGNFGCVGFCWGGALANQIAVHSSLVKASVAFYGRQPKPEEVSKIKGAVQLHYGGLDTRINEGIPAYEEALKKANIPYELYMYEGQNHAFHNDTSAARYNEAAAKLAWQRTIDFWKKYLQ